MLSTHLGLNVKYNYIDLRSKILKLLSVAEKCFVVSEKLVERLEKKFFRVL